MFMTRPDDMIFKDFVNLKSDFFNIASDIKSKLCGHKQNLEESYF